MKTVVQSNRSLVVSGFITTLAVAAMSFAGSAEARDNVSWSIGVGTPGAVVSVGNGGSFYPSQPVYVQQQPVYAQPAPVYYQQRPVYVQPAPVYYQPRPVFVRPQPFYIAPQPVYYERPRGHYRHNRHHGGYYGPEARGGYGGGYAQGNAPVYYQRDGRR